MIFNPSILPNIHSLSKIEKEVYVRGLSFGCINVIIAGWITQENDPNKTQEVILGLEKKGLLSPIQEGSTLYRLLSPEDLLRIGENFI